MADTNGSASIDVTNLREIERGRSAPSKRRINLNEQAPSLKVVMDRGRQFTTAYINGYVGPRDPDFITMDQMRRMRRDPMIAFGIAFKKAVIVNAPWHVVGTDPRANAFVTEALQRVYSRLLLQMLTALEFGYAPIVKRFELLAPRWTYTDATGAELPVWDNSLGVKALVWEDPRLLPPEGAEPKFQSDEETFNGIKHNRMQRKTDTPGPLEVDVQHSLWFTNERDESFGNWYGYPLTGYAFDFWWDSTYRRLLENRHFEQDADPPLLIRVPEGTSPDPEDPDNTVDNRDLGLYVGQALRDGATVVMSSETYIDDTTGRPSSVPMWDASFLQGGENLAAFRASSEYLDVMKLRAVWVPEQALVEGKGGTSSRNVAATYGDAFASQQAILAGALVQAINDYMIPDLLAQNFVDPPTCTMEVTGFRQEDMGLAADLLKLWLSQNPRGAMIDWRKLVYGLNLPALTFEEQKALNEQLNELQPTVTTDGETGGMGGAPNPMQSNRAQLTVSKEALDAMSKEEVLLLGRLGGTMAPDVEIEVGT